MDSWDISFIVQFWNDLKIDTLVVQVIFHNIIKPEAVKQEKIFQCHLTIWLHTLCIEQCNWFAHYHCKTQRWAKEKGFLWQETVCFWLYLEHVGKVENNKRLVHLVCMGRESWKRSDKSSSKGIIRKGLTSNSILLGIIHMK